MPDRGIPWANNGDGALRGALYREVSGPQALWLSQLVPNPALAPHLLYQIFPRRHQEGRGQLRLFQGFNYQGTSWEHSQQYQQLYQPHPPQAASLYSGHMAVCICLLPQELSHTLVTQVTRHAPTRTVGEQSHQLRAWASGLSHEQAYT